MRKVLKKKFFNRSAPEVAKDLLGKFLVRKWKGREISAQIVEVEVYEGFRDKASHASRGKTKRNSVMFGPAGVWYVYLIYGMHWMLDVVTGPKEYPAAVLIRGIKGADTPGKLTKNFKINKKFNERAASRTSGLWIEDRGVNVTSDKRQATRRVGVEYAGPYWSNRKWRFVLRSYPHLV